MIYRNLSHSLHLLNKHIHILFGKINIIKAAWWGVKIGKGPLFQGTCYFKRFPGSSILIGNNCTFLSQPFSNQIGINHACMINTQTREAKITIGNNCGFSGTVIGAFCYIKLGNNVRCGANTLITDSDWHYNDSRIGVPLEIIIEDNVWIGINVIVLKGVRIGTNSIIGAGSIVTKSIPANVVAAGNPCKVIKSITLNK
jgi:acetyltransferase-like isoleucine patch superfamily enzyme